MTNEEAIKWLTLQKNKGILWDDYSDETKGIRENAELRIMIAYEMAIEALEQEPKIGHWINLENTKYKGQVLPFWSRYECSKCGGHGEGTFNYCPNCGARMTESEEV